VHLPCYFYGYFPPKNNSLCVHTSSDLAPPETRVIMEDLNPQCSLGSRYSISGGVKPSFLQATYQIYQVFVGESFFFVRLRLRHELINFYQLSHIWGLFWKPWILQCCIEAIGGMAGILPLSWNWALFCVYFPRTGPVFAPMLSLAWLNSKGLQDTKWGFPKIRVPANHPFKKAFTLINHPFWGTPIYGNLHISIVLIRTIFGERLLSIFWVSTFYLNRDFKPFS